VLTNTSSQGRPWEDKIEATLKHVTTHKYVSLLSKQLVGILLCIYVKQQHMSSVTNVDADSVGTGILGMMGNKGGCAIRFNFYDTSLCFVTSHLAAHMRDTARRNQDHQEIIRRISFQGLTVAPDFMKREELTASKTLGLHDHDHVFWFGDLNYRIPLAGDEIKAKVAEQAWQYLADYDQLKLQQQAGAAFVDYEEGPLHFAPSYKYDPGTNTYDTSEKHRPPAWCDRILWKSKRPDRVKQARYTNHMELMTSDHKPVSSVFYLDLVHCNKDKKHKVEEEVVEEQKRFESEHLPDVQLECDQIKFDAVKYGVSYQKRVDLVNTGPVPVRFSFANRPGTNETSPPWLVIATQGGVIQPGDKRSLIFNLFINITVAQELNSLPGKFEDKLILRIEGGKEYKIGVVGNYLKSCFGRTVDELCRIPGPVRTCLPQAVSGHPSLPLRIPKELWRLVDALYRTGLDEEYLFIERGVKAEIEEIKDCLETGLSFPNEVSSHSLAEGLLLFLEGFTEPVIPFNLYPESLQAGPGTFAAAKAVIDKLPAVNYQTFVYVMAFLREVLNHSGGNKLKPDTLALVFSGVVLSDKKTRDTALQKYFFFFFSFIHITLMFYVYVRRNRSTYFFTD
jgi:phosphatidylinositol-bisphosphatase